MKKYWANLNELNNEAYNNVSKSAATKALTKIKGFKEIGNFYFDIIFTKLSIPIPNSYEKLFEFLEKYLNLDDTRI